MIVRPAAPVSADVQPAERPSAIAQTVSFIERRFARRKAASANAQIVSADLTVPLSCIVRDVSSTGARIELAVAPENPLGGRAKLPANFTLLMRMDRMEVDCAIAWRNGPFVGVRYVSTPRFQTKTSR
jgi:hypothetical protein